MDLAFASRVDPVAVARPSSEVHWESSLVSSSFAVASYVEAAEAVEAAFGLDDLASSLVVLVVLDELQVEDYVGLHWPLKDQCPWPCFSCFGDH